MPRGADTYVSLIEPGSHTWTYSDERTVHVKLGARVVFTAPGDLVGLQYLRHPLNNGVMIGGIWNTTGGALITASMQVVPPDEDVPETASWHRLYLHPRFRPTVDAEYEIGVYFDRAYYAYEPGGLAADITAGPITFPASVFAGNLNGVYTYGPIDDPFGSGNHQVLYGIDVLFRPDP